MSVLYKKGVPPDGVPKYNEAVPVNTRNEVEKAARMNDMGTSPAPTQLDNDRINTFRDYTLDHYRNKIADNYFTGDRAPQLKAYQDYMQENKGTGASSDERTNAIEVAERYALDENNRSFYVPEDEFQNMLPKEEYEHFQSLYYDDNNDSTKGTMDQKRAIGARALAKAQGNRGIYDNLGTAPLYPSLIGDDTANIGSLNKGLTSGNTDQPFTYEESKYLPYGKQQELNLEYYRDNATMRKSPDATQSTKDAFNAKWDAYGKRIKSDMGTRKMGGVLYKKN